MWFFTGGEERGRFSIVAILGIDRAKAERGGRRRGGERRNDEK